MNIRDLQYLVAVHDMNSFSKAAERCYVSQPTLSGQLKKLEDELNAPLIERSTRQVLFTALGEKVVGMARDLLLTADNIRATAKANEDPFSGDFHIGLIPTVGPFLLPMLMPVLSEEFPDTQFYLYELQADELVEKLLKGEIDAAILAKSNDSQAVQEIPLYSEAMTLAVHNEDELANSEQSLALSTLNGRSLMMLDDGHCLRDQTLDVCSSAGAHENVNFKATSMDTLLHMVANGSGVTLVPQLASNKSINGVSYLDFDEPKPSREIVMMHRNHCARKPALSVFADHISQLVDCNHSVEH